MEEKNYTLTEKELFDLIESEIDTAICGTVVYAMKKYNADSEIMNVFIKLFQKSTELSNGLPPRIKKISDAFHEERIK